MNKIILVLGLLIGGLALPAQAAHVAPQAGTPQVLANFCFDTTKYFDEITKINVEQGFNAAKRRWGEIMRDPSISCYSGVRISAILVERVSETLNLKNATGGCFNVQIWLVRPADVSFKGRTVYTTWHRECPTEA